MIKTKDSDAEFHRLDSKWAYEAAVIFLAGLFVMTFVLTEPYSYWHDELCSVTASNGSVSALYDNMMSDVHPPLYQLVLQAWIRCWGEGEFATRSLSWLFSVAAVALVILFARRYGAVFQFCCVVVFCSSPLLAYYANETRAYAMLLFFSTFALTSYPHHSLDKPSLRLLVACWLLSLTHYFGLILAGLILGSCLLRYFKDAKTISLVIGTGMLCLAWPVHHAINGNILSKTGGNFWIEVNGVAHSLEIAASGFLPRWRDHGAVILIAGIGCAMAAALFIGRGKDNKQNEMFSIALWSAVMLMAFLLVVALIDLRSPISTRRNYIALLPLITLLTSSVAALLCARFARAASPLLLVLFLFGLDSVTLSRAELRFKASLGQDWKGAAEFAMTVAPGKTLYYTAAAANDRGREPVATYYLKRAGGNALSAEAFVPGKTQLKRPALVLSGHDAGYHELLYRELPRLGGVRIFPETERGGGSTASVWVIE